MLALVAACLVVGGCGSSLSRFQYSIAADDCDIQDPKVPQGLVDNCLLGLSDTTDSSPVRQMSAGFDPDQEVYVLMVQSSEPIAALEADGGEVVKVTTHVGVMTFPFESPARERFSLSTSEGKTYRCSRVRGTVVVDC